MIVRSTHFYPTRPIPLPTTKLTSAHKISKPSKHFSSFISFNFFWIHSSIQFKFCFNMTYPHEVKPRNLQVMSRVSKAKRFLYFVYYTHKLCIFLIRLVFRLNYNVNRVILTTKVECSILIYFGISVSRTPMYLSAYTLDT